MAAQPACTAPGGARLAGRALASLCLPSAFLSQVDVKNLCFHVLWEATVLPVCRFLHGMEDPFTKHKLTRTSENGSLSIVRSQPQSPGQKPGV